MIHLLLLAAVVFTSIVFWICIADKKKADAQQILTQGDPRYLPLLDPLPIVRYTGSRPGYEETIL